MTDRLVTTLLAVISGCVAIAVTTAFFDGFDVLWPREGSPAFLWGAGVGIILGIMIFLKLPLISTLEHEITHMLVALCLFRKPLRVVADPYGGETVYRGRGSVLIRLAPYFLPTATLILLFLVAILDISKSKSVILFLGMTWGFHLSTGVMESTPRQPDLRRGGLIASYAASISLCLIFYPMTALATVVGWSAVGQWLELAWQQGSSIITGG